MSDATTWTNLLLKKQEMQAEADQQGEAMKMAQMRQLLGAASQFAGNMGSAMKQQKQDAIANRLMNEDTPPVATAVDPAVQKQVMADRAAAGVEGPAAPATGGLDEMKLRLKMDDQKLQEMAMQLRGHQEARLADMAKNESVARQQADAAKAFQSSSKDMQESFNDSMAYYKTVGVGLNQAAEAQTPEQHAAAAAGVMSMYQAAKKRGLDIEPPQVPVFMTPEQRAAQAAQQAELEAARTSLGSMKNDYIPNWFGGDEKQAAKVKELEASAASVKPQYMPVPAVSGPARVSVPTRDSSVAQLQQEADADLTLPVDDAPTVPVKTQADFDALSSGSYYTGPDGKTYRKP